jgi:predicted PurR-regulated permease PerM
MSEPQREASDRRRVLYPLVACLLIVAFLALQVFRPFFAIFTVTASVALLLAPLQSRLTAACGGRRGLAAALIVVVTTVLILVPVTTSALLLSEQAVQFFDWVKPRVQPAALQALWRETLPQRYPGLQGFLRFDEEEASQAISAILSRVATTANALLQRTLAGVGEALLDLFLFLMMLFFLLRDGKRLRDELQAISPLSKRRENEIFLHLTKTVRGVLQAMILVPIGQGLVAAIGFLIFGVPSPIAWSVSVVLAALVPILGSPLGWVPAVAYLFLYGETWQWVGLLVFGIVLISGVDNLIKPLILQGAANIHPLPAFLSILGGLISFGPLGFLIGPVILSLVLSAIRIYRADVLSQDASGARSVPS